MLRNKTITEQIKPCRYYHNIFEYPEYVYPWKVYRLHDDSYKRRCWELESKRNIYHPRIRRELNDIYNYKNILPLEHFTTGQSNHTYIVLLILIVLIYIAY